jgi:adenylate kinase
VALADLILADFETVNEHQRSGVILGGTPGVGKSTFLAFLLCCCYVQRKFKPHLFGDVLLSIKRINRCVALGRDEGSVCLLAIQ